MRDSKVIEEMVALAERFGQKIEFDEFDGRGGWCRVKGTDRVIINERLTPREQIRILAQVLAGYPIEEQSMAPRVRQIIEEAKLEHEAEPRPVSDNHTVSGSDSSHLQQSEMTSENGPDSGRQPRTEPGEQNGKTDRPEASTQANNEPVNMEQRREDAQS